MYDSDLKYKWDNENVLDHAIKEATNKGKIEGKLEEAREIAREMKIEGVTIDQIIKFTKLPYEEIEKL